MAVKLTSTSIWSQDLNNLLPFYRDVLGMPVRMESPRYVQLGGPADPPLALGSHSDVHGKATDPARHIVALETNDIHAEYARLKAKGVEFIEEPVDGGPVIFASFKDPEDNILQLIQFK